MAGNRHVLGGLRRRLRLQRGDEAIRVLQADVEAMDLSPVSGLKLHRVRRSGAGKHELNDAVSGTVDVPVLAGRMNSPGHWPFGDETCGFDVFAWNIKTKSPAVPHVQCVVVHPNCRLLGPQADHRRQCPKPAVISERKLHINILPWAVPWLT